MGPSKGTRCVLRMPTPQLQIDAILLLPVTDQLVIDPEKVV